MRRFTSSLPRRAPLAAAALATLALAACDLEFEKVTVPAGRARPVVHGVLNPFGPQQFSILLERTLSGRVEVREGAFDIDDPVVSGGGEPVSGARVVISSADPQDQGIGIERVDLREDGKGRGVYLFENFGCTPFACPSNGIVLRRGSTYTLEIQTPQGEIVTGTTTIPIGFPRSDTGSRTTFNASRDTYVFRWPAAETLRRYAVQIQTPFGPFQTFSDVESLAVNGTLRNFQQERFPRVFVPGFRQELQSLAVDRNYFDYYRSENDPFTGSGLVSSVTGGSGVFGAVQPIRTQQLDVTAPFDEPVDGRWALVGDASGFPPRLTTYADGSFASGRYEDPSMLESLLGMLGQRTGSTLRLAVLSRQSPRDTVWTYVAEVRGDTLFTSSPEKGEQKWRRLPGTP